MNTVLRAIEAQDVGTFRKTLDAVCREKLYLCFQEAPPIEQVEEFVLNNIETGNPQFVGVDRDTGELVGWCDITRSDYCASHHVGRLGMGLLAGFRGQGLGTRLIITTIKTAFASDFERIELEVFSNNSRAIGLYEKVGFQHEGIKRKTRKINGEFVDSVMMGLLKNEFTNDN